MMITPLRRLMQPLLTIALAVALASSAMAANQFKAFFPIDNDPFITYRDDQAIVKPIFWSQESQPVRFVLMETSSLQALLPTLNLDQITADEVELALERAIARWNDNDLSSFKLDSNVYQLLSGGVDNPLPVDADFDGHNVISFLSQTLTSDGDTYAAISFFFFERDFKVDTDEKLRIDLIESTAELDLDFNTDGRVDITIPDRQYFQGEIIEADIVGNSAIYFRDWPEHIEDVDDNKLWEVPGSADIEAIAARCFGFVQGLTSSLIYNATLNNQIDDGFAFDPRDPVDPGFISAFLENPFERRTLDYDDKLAAALLYPGNLAGKGEISGNIYDGRLVQAANALPEGVDPLFFDDELLVIGAPVFLAAPAPDEKINADDVFYRDENSDTTSSLRFIAQVYSGQTILLETLSGGVVGLEPASLEPPVQIAESSGILLPDLTILEGTFDSAYKFIGLEPNDNYAVYIDQERYDETGLTNFVFIGGIPDFNPVMKYFNDRETFNPEWFGGAPSGAPYPDAEFDDSDRAQFIKLGPGEVFDTADIITNVGEADEGDSGTPNGEHSPAIKFANDTEAVPYSDYVGVSGDMGDINNDGWLDFIVAVFAGGNDAGGARINRIYINVPKNPDVPEDGRRFQDVTFGFDGVPSTSDDVLPANRDISRDAKLGDFNNDGRLDIIVSNADAPNRLYLNEPEPNNPWGFRMREVSDQVLPGVLNRPWADAPDDSGRMAVGDLDADGDLDVIISLLTPQTDLFGTSAVIEQVVRNPLNDPDAEGGDHSYDPVTDPITGFNESGNGGGLQIPGGVGGSPLLFAERILINHPDSTPGGPGFRFVDETLGADNVFGDSSLLPAAVPPLGTDNDYEYKFSANTDRVPPIYPTTITFNDNAEPQGEFASPMCLTAFEPHIGPMWGDAGLDFFSVRYFSEANNGLQNAYFQNLDIKGITRRGQTTPEYGRQELDTIPDGYFACLNYGTDWAFGGGGFYCLRYNDGDTTVRLDPMPLFIGIPDGGPLDVAAPPETDIFAPVNRSGFAGVLGDFEYRGAPKPFILTDNSNGEYYTFRPAFAGSSEEGARRGQPPGFLTGLSNMHFPQISQSIAIGTDPSSVIVEELAYGGLLDGPGGAAAAIEGESHGGVAADFDHDGDFDIMIAKNVAFGFVPTGAVVIGEGPISNTFLENRDGFADFYNTSAAVGMTNSLVSFGYGYMPLAGDIDNDGDIDSVIISAFGPHRVYLNNIYTPFVKPDNSINFDATQFYDATGQYLPPIYGGTLNPPFTNASTFSSATTSVGVADFNGDGRPDITFADGGAFNLETERPQIYFNGGGQRQEARFAFNEAMKVFVPIGAPNPAPRILMPLPFVDFEAGIGPQKDIGFGPKGGFGGESIAGLGGSMGLTPGTHAAHDLPNFPLQGYVNDDLGSYYGVSAGDFSGDGSPDLFFTRNGKGPNAYINLDIHELAANSRPDPDTKGDGFFLNLDQLDDYIGDPGHVFLPDLVDPCPGGVANTVRKNLNRRVTAADFDGNGTLDVVIANGTQDGGAANVLLLNFLEGIQLLRPHFYDFTETNLPTVEGLCGLPEGIPDDTYHIAAGDFDHDGDIDMIFGNQSNFLLASDFPAFRYLENDGTAVFTDTALTKGNIPTFENTTPRYLLTGDFDGVGEWTEDINHNGILDSGEDMNDNGVIDVSEDKNANGFLDPGEDLNGNGKLDFVDLPDESVAGDINGDGIITHRTKGVWEPSLDIVITFETFKPAILINDPTNQNPGFFTDQTAARFGQPSLFSTVPNRGARAGDMDNDGDLDIVMTIQREFRGPLLYYVNDGKGVFTDRTVEIPAPHSVTQGSAGDTFDRPNNPYDVELSDLDGDGDLDIVLGMAGIQASLVTIGGENIVYINRTVGGNFQSGAALQGLPDAAAAKDRGPLVYFADPPKTLPGVSLDVTLTGSGLTHDTVLDFGAGVHVGAINYLSPSQLRVHITVDAAAAPGPRRIEVTDTAKFMTSRTSEGAFRVQGVGDNAVDDEVWQQHD